MNVKVLGATTIIVGVLLAVGPAMAQPVRIRGQITKVDGSVLMIKTREGDDVTVHLADKANVAIIVKAALSDIKPNSYIGTAAMPQPDGTLKALEVTIFPPALKGTGEGSREFDLQPGSTMTNATVTGTVSGASGPTLTLTYANGSKTVVVPPNTPIVTFVPGTMADVKAGAGTIIFGGDKSADGKIDAKSIMVGRDGVNPPM